MQGCNLIDRYTRGRLGSVYKYGLISQGLKSSGAALPVLLLLHVIYLLPGMPGCRVIDRYTREQAGEGVLSKIGITRPSKHCKPPGRYASYSM